MNNWSSGWRKLVVEKHEMKKFKTEWTGSYPSLCSGVWKLYVDGKDKSDLIPEDLRNYPMETAGMYQTWHFED